MNGALVFLPQLCRSKGWTIIKQLACNDVVKGCTFVAKAPNEQELLRQVAAGKIRHEGSARLTRIEAGAA